nr:hypothetical protein CFP56_00867 [Quercus suber]
MRKSKGSVSGTLRRQRDNGSAVAATAEPAWKNVACGQAKGRRNPLRMISRKHRAGGFATWCASRGPAVEHGSLVSLTRVSQNDRVTESRMTTVGSVAVKRGRVRICVERMEKQKGGEQESENERHETSKRMWTATLGCLGLKQDVSGRDAGPPPPIQGTSWGQGGRHPPIPPSTMWPDRVHSIHTFWPSLRTRCLAHSWILYIPWSLRRLRHCPRSRELNITLHCPMPGSSAADRPHAVTGRTQVQIETDSHRGVPAIPSRVQISHRPFSPKYRGLAPNQMLPPSPPRTRDRCQERHARSSSSSVIEAQGNPCPDIFESNPGLVLG